ncbi:Transcriptional activator CadC [Luteitalea pratensis]|uniref:Transcriptional activator CadC n=1 Tax=Luteitalea pratensis TaxID=1855912 RepID=A0A143PS36_LUTPR|nr:winged helix-turn-helix domain-containing protein [Luteitalea pratensis]AMY11435.1 Transcriptional activator CadC [Luteitalea pratensis]
MNQTCDRAAVRFGPFLCEPINGRLLRAGAELGVPPRSLAILGCLVQRPCRLVTKQDLLDHVWKDAFVTDTSLSEAVSVLRQALGDDAQEPSHVQTVPRRGYRVEPAGDPLPVGQQLASESSLAVSADGRLIVGVLVVRQQAPVALRPLPVVR